MSHFSFNLYPAVTPWNMFITVSEIIINSKLICNNLFVIYFQAKNYFVDYKLSYNYTGVNNSDYGPNFMPYVTFASQIPNVLFNWMNIFVNLG
jgi:hypothetical protein